MDNINFIEFLNRSKQELSNQKIVLATPNITIKFLLRDAQIYEGENGEVVIYSEFNKEVAKNPIREMNL